MIVSQVLDDGEETAAFARVYLPFYVAGYEAGAENVRTRRKRADFFNLVRERLRQKSFYHAALALKVTKRRLQSVFDEALVEGWGTEDLAREVRHLFDGMARGRSLRIARTELTDVMNDGSNATLREEGYRMKEWSTVIDGQERETHAEADGQVVGVNELFTVGGQAARYPGDDSLSASEKINCRCLIVGAGTPDERKHRLGRAFLRAHGALERRFVVHLRKAFRSQRDRILSRLAP